MYRKKYEQINDLEKLCLQPSENFEYNFIETWVVSIMLGSTTLLRSKHKVEILIKLNKILLQNYMFILGST